MKDLNFRIKILVFNKKNLKHTRKEKQVFLKNLKLVQNPGILEGTLAHLSGLLLELLDGTLVDTTTFVDQVTSGGGFTGIYL